MVTKTFKSPTTLQTLQMVQAELGADAIVVSMREVPAGPIWNPWQKTSVEVVAASPDFMPELQRSKERSEPALPEGLFGAEEEVRPEIEWVETPAKKKSGRKAGELPPKLKLNLEPVAEDAPAPAAARKAPPRPRPSRRTPKNICRLRSRRSASSCWMPSTPTRPHGAWPSSLRPWTQCSRPSVA